MNSNAIALKSSSGINILKFKKLTEKLVSLNPITTKSADEGKRAICKIAEWSSTEISWSVKNFYKFDQKFNIFFCKLLPSKDYHSLSAIFILVFVHLLFCMSSIEQGFKNKEFLVKNTSEGCLKLVKLIQDHLLS